MQPWPAPSYDAARPTVAIVLGEISESIKDDLLVDRAAELTVRDVETDRASDIQDVHVDPPFRAGKPSRPSRSTPLRARYCMTFGTISRAEAGSFTTATVRVQQYRGLPDRSVDPRRRRGLAQRGRCSATRHRAPARRAEGRTPRIVDRDAIRTVLANIGGLTGLLASSNPGDRAEFYEAVGIAGTYEPQINQVLVTTHPVGNMVRVGGGT